jgi:NADH:ubiquinone oxidoreductase subunit H
MVFLGEYGSMIVSAILLINIFVSCFYLWVTILLIVVLLIIYSVGRIFLPRYRIDQLVFGVWGALCWMVFICFELSIIDCL